MRWIKRGEPYDTDLARLVFSFPSTVPHWYAGDEYGRKWSADRLGVAGGGLMSDPQVWEAIDGRWFVTCNRESVRLTEDGTDFVAYHDWDDPKRTPEDLNRCCRPLRDEEHARRLVEDHASAEEYEAMFGRHVVPPPPTPGAARHITSTLVNADGTTMEVVREAARRR